MADINIFEKEWLSGEIENMVKKGQITLSDYLISGPAPQVNLKNILTPSRFEQTFYTKTEQGDWFDSIKTTQKHLICLFGRRGVGKSVAVGMLKERFLGNKNSNQRGKPALYDGCVMLDAENEQTYGENGTIDRIPVFFYQLLLELLNLLKKLCKSRKPLDNLNGFLEIILSKLNADDFLIKHHDFLFKIIEQEIFLMEQKVGELALERIVKDLSISFDQLFEFYILLVAYKNFDLNKNNNPNGRLKDKRTVFIFDNLEDCQADNIKHIAAHYENTVLAIEKRFSQQLVKNKSASVLARPAFEFKEQFKFIFVVRTSSRFLDFENNIQLDSSPWALIPFISSNELQYQFLKTKMDFIREGKAMRETKKAFLEIGELVEWLSKPIKKDDEKNIFALFNYNFRAAIHVFCYILSDNIKIKDTIKRIKNEYDRTGVSEEENERNKISLARQILLGAMFRQILWVGKEQITLVDYFYSKGLGGINEQADKATLDGAGYSFTRAILTYLYWSERSYDIYNESPMEFKGIPIREICVKFLNPKRFNEIAAFDKRCVYNGIKELSALGGGLTFKMAENIKWDGYLIEHALPTSRLTDNSIEAQIKLYELQVSLEDQKKVLESNPHSLSQNEEIAKLDASLEELASKDICLKLSPAGKLFVEYISKIFELFLSRIESKGNKLFPKTLFEYNLTDAVPKQPGSCEMVMEYTKPINRVYNAVEKFIICNTNIISKHCIYAHPSNNGTKRDCQMCFRKRNDNSSKKNHNEELLKCSIVTAHQEIAYVLKESINYLIDFKILNKLVDENKRIINEWISKFKGLRDYAIDIMSKQYLEKGCENFNNISTEIKKSLNEVNKKINMQIKNRRTNRYLQIILLEDIL